MESLSNGENVMRLGIIVSILGCGLASVCGCKRAESSAPAPPPVSAASFLGMNSTTGGSWAGVYGSEGVDISGVGYTLPSYAAVSTTGVPFTWEASTTEARAPQNLTGTDRVAADWYGTSNSFDFSLSFTNGSTHQVALYVLDFDNQNRQESIQVLNPSTQAQLASVSVYPFTNGAYAIFNVSGSVIFRITKMSGGGPALTGIFIDPPGHPTSLPTSGPASAPTSAPASGVTPSPTSSPTP